MAGNVWDWTLEGNGSYYRSYRGGGYYNDGSNGPASNRYSNYPSNSNYYIGFRAYFYIK